MDKNYDVLLTNLVNQLSLLNTLTNTNLSQAELAQLAIKGEITDDTISIIKSIVSSMMVIEESIKAQTTLVSQTLDTISE